MDIKVITRHGPSNYGSLLQSIATIKIVERLGHKCEIIDYRRKDERGLKAVLTALNQKENWRSNLIKKFIYVLVRFPEECIAERFFDKYRDKHLKTTETCNTHKDLKRLTADVFMTGSDQVWGPLLCNKYDDAYFLSFVNNTKKIAYAASFGRTEFNKSILSEYKSLLSQYNAITVRESSAVDLLKQLDVRCNGQVLDPTLLLTGKEWSTLIEKNICHKYVLVYQIHNDTKLNDYAVRFAKSKGLPLIRISAYLHQIMRGGKFVYLPTVGEFLAYIKQCTYFITDSFHGTAFAINFNKQFIEILPNTKTGSRNQSILKLTGLEGRIINDYNDFSIADSIIDYDKVNDIIDSERQKSIGLLKAMIE